MKITTRRSTTDFSNFLSHHDSSFTRNVDREVVEGMHRRYHTAFQLDDEVLTSQSGYMKHHPHPLPWGLMLAFAAIATSLTGLLYWALIGGINLG